MGQINLLENDEKRSCKKKKMPDFYHKENEGVTTIFGYFELGSFAIFPRFACVNKIHEF